MHAGSAAGCRGGLSVPGPAAGHFHTCASSHGATRSAVLAPGPQSESLGQIALITVVLCTNWGVEEQVRESRLCTSPSTYSSTPSLLVLAIDWLLGSGEKGKGYPGRVLRKGEVLKSHLICVDAPFLDDVKLLSSDAPSYLISRASRSGAVRWMAARS